VPRTLLEHEIFLLFIPSDYFHFTNLHINVSAIRTWHLFQMVLVLLLGRISQKYVTSITKPKSFLELSRQNAIHAHSGTYWIFSYAIRIQWGQWESRLGKFPNRNTYLMGLLKKVLQYFISFALRESNFQWTSSLMLRYCMGQVKWVCISYWMYMI